MNHQIGSAPVSSARRIRLHDPHPKPPLALPNLPRLTQRLVMAHVISRTDNLRRASLDASLPRQPLRP